MKKSYNVGKNNPMYKGGKESRLSYCKICNKLLSQASYYRKIDLCVKHSRIGKKHSLIILEETDLKRKDII